MKFFSMVICVYVMELLRSTRNCAFGLSTLIGLSMCVSRTGIHRFRRWKVISRYRVRYILGCNWKLISSVDYIWINRSFLNWIYKWGSRSKRIFIMWPHLEVLLTDEWICLNWWSLLGRILYIILLCSKCVRIINFPIKLILFLYTICKCFC